MEINWIQKLTSRKFWAAVISFITAILVFFKIESEQVEKIVALIGAFASLIAYTIAEGMVDVARAESEITFYPEEPPEEE